MHTPEERDLARRVRLALAEADMRKGEFARLAGLNPGYLSEVIHGKVAPGELAVIKLERALATLAARREEVNA
jgi:transcriptional regulator with XRE-family HTH domain